MIFSYLNIISLPRRSYKLSTISCIHIMQSDFKHELTMLSKLHHPNIVMFLGACLEVPHLYLITEWVSRGSLQFVLNDDSINLSWPLVIRIASQMAMGLQYLHSKNIVHRDVKPHSKEMIMLSIVYICFLL